MPKLKQLLEDNDNRWYSQKSAEVIVNRQRAATSQAGSAEVSQKEEGPNVRMVTGSQSNWQR